MDKNLDTADQQVLLPLRRALRQKAGLRQQDFADHSG